MVVKLPDTCLKSGVPCNTWSNVAVCPNCRRELRITVAPCCGKTPRTPLVYPSHPFPLQAAHLLQQNCYKEECERLSQTLQSLKISGWYYSNLDWQGARTLLKDAAPGAFIIRNSGDMKFIFSLSMQTERGPTSVRLHYERGYFRLDCDESLTKYMPRFQSVLELVQHYASAAMQGVGGTVWVDREGCPHSPVLLKKPLRKTQPSLLHLSRLAIHRALDSNPLTPKLHSAPKHILLPLPSTLLDYLGEYPYWI